jgi:hypothetical protein
MSPSLPRFQQTWREMPQKFAPECADSMAPDFTNAGIAVFIRPLADLGEKAPPV